MVHHEGHKIAMKEDVHDATSGKEVDSHYQVVYACMQRYSRKKELEMTVRKMHYWRLEGNVLEWKPFYIVIRIFFPFEGLTNVDVLV
jgi:hypothetical protein